MKIGTRLLGNTAALVLYGNEPRYSYFVGCSKGGQEGMMATQRYPALFDGIVSGALGFSLPRAAWPKRGIQSSSRR